MNCYAIVHFDQVCIYSMNETYRDAIVKLRKNVVLKHFSDLFKDIKNLKTVLFEPDSIPFVLKKLITGQRLNRTRLD